MRVTRRLLLLALLGIIFIGCKTKRTVSGNSDRGRYKSPPKVAEVKKEEKKKDDGLYVMPEDTGKFILFQIDSPEEYIKTFSEIAQMEMKAYGNNRILLYGMVHQHIPYSTTLM